MRWQRPKLRFSLRLLLLLVALATLPAWWVATKRSEYFAEQRALRRMRQHAPELSVDQGYYGPDWLGRCGYLPAWLYRVDAIDVTGSIYGPNPGWRQGMPFPFDFDDADFAAIDADLRQFRKLRSLYLPMTKMTDRSLPALHEYDQLTFLNIYQTAMTSPAVKQLEQARPEMKVSFSHGYDQMGNKLRP